MMTEIERKFLVQENLWGHDGGDCIAQGYLFADAQKTVRVRLRRNKGYITVKGKTNGISRSEFEYEIPAEDAEAMLNLCGDKVIKKRRHLESIGGNLWEIDVFEGANAPLVLAEIELKHEEQDFVKPPWLGEEVSYDNRYFNSYLAEHPYGAW